MMNFINKIMSLFKELDKKNIKIMCIGLKFCLFILIISVLILFTYLFYKNYLIYEIGILIFELSLYFGIDFIVSGLVVDIIKKQIT